MVVTWKEAAPQDKEMPMLSTKRSRAKNDGRNLEIGYSPRQRNAHALDEAVKGKEVEKQPKAD
jgi:hypothetical protein